VNTSIDGVLNPKTLAGKVALVTGAAQGIGRGVALELARAGADIAINDLPSHERADEVAQAVTALGRRATIHPADVSDREAVDQMARTVVAVHGRLDILVNNAGVYHAEPFLEISEQWLDRLINVNLKGVILCGQAAARQMAAQGGGRVVNISSVHAISSFRHAAVYDATKAAVMRLTATMALDLAAYRITVNAIGPGWTDTPLNAPELDTPAKRVAVEATIPLGRVGRPEEIGTLAAFLCSEAGSYITGVFISIDGGLRLGQ
jgi:NAD(P)-dependent dehydrogenase (short-subunit alcohol dehydrogenase family)